MVRFSWAEIFEDHLQTPRLSKLRRCFGAAAEVRFAPRAAAAQRFLGAGFLGDARGVPRIGMEKSVEKYGNMLKSIWFNLVYSNQFIGK